MHTVYGHNDACNGACNQSEESIFNISVFWTIFFNSSARRPWGMPSDNPPPPVPMTTSSHPAPSHPLTVPMVPPTPLQSRDPSPGVRRWPQTWASIRVIPPSPVNPLILELIHRVRVALLPPPLSEGVSCIGISSGKEGNASESWGDVGVGGGGGGGELHCVNNESASR